MYKVFRQQNNQFSCTAIASDYDWVFNVSGELTEEICCAQFAIIYDEKAEGKDWQ